MVRVLVLPVCLAANLPSPGSEGEGAEDPDPINLVIAGGHVHDGDGEGIGNNNALVDAGEEIDLEMTLLNLGSEEITNLTGTLTSSDPYVVITDGFTRWPDIAPLTFEVGNDNFEFSVLQNCPLGRIVDFTLELSSDQGSQTKSFQILVSSSLPDVPLKVLSFQVRPGTIELEFTSKVYATYTVKTATDCQTFQPLTVRNNIGKPFSTSIQINGPFIGTNEFQAIQIIETY